MTFDPLGPQEMLPTELAVLADLVRTSGAREILEIGMANASSTIAMLTVLAANGGGHVTSIDPFQLAPVQAVEGMVRGFGAAGVDNVRKAGFERLHTLIPALDYVALPELVRSGRRFDLVFIDGYHSFDYTMVDFFYADLLTRTGGHVVFHDSACEAVYRVCEFVAANKAYRPVGPPPALIYSSVIKRALRRVRVGLTGQAAAFRERRTRWKSLAVFVKQADGLADQFVVHGA